MHRVYLAILILASLPACAGGNQAAGLPVAANAGVRPLTLRASDFTRVVAWGAKGKPAVAQCPQGDEVIAGGSSSSDGSSVGTGSPSSGRKAWVVQPDSSASAEAFATCVTHEVARANFQWRSASPTNGLADAQCRSDDQIVTGYGSGTVSDSWYDASTNSYWVSGGGEAVASCVRRTAGVIIKHAWNQSQKPKAVYAGCGSGYTVIGGSMGDSQWPGPPIQQHPGDGSKPSQHGYDGWWTFSNALNELTWAACVSS
jgi:hypothetical protein